MSTTVTGSPPRGQAAPRTPAVPGGLQVQGPRRWFRLPRAAATLATLWQVYEAYSAVIDQAAEAVRGHLGPRELAWITTLLTGSSIQLSAGPAPLAGRDLADSGRENLTVVEAVTRMRRSFSQITEVVSAAEQVWNEMTSRLGAAEDPGLTERYDRARGLLWTAPCDLAAAADAVTSYQQAVLALGG